MVRVIVQCCCQDLFKSLENKTEILDKLSAVEFRDVGFEIITLGEGQVLYGGQVSAMLLSGGSKCPGGGKCPAFARHHSGAIDENTG